MSSVDIAHLTFKPPFLPGSFNRLIGNQLDLIPDPRQAAICYWDEPLPEGIKPDSRVVLVNDEGLSVRQKSWLRLPERVRSNWFNGVARRQNLVYLWGTLNVLRQMRPKVVISHDNYKFGVTLRKNIDWPCRLVLWQHGLSYHLPPALAPRFYSLKSFDEVVVLSRASYRFDRNRMSYYESAVQVLHNWVDTDRFQPASEEQRRAFRARWSLPQDKQLVLWLSRLVPQKGAHILLQCWPQILRECPDAFLWIVGGGDAGYQNYLKSLIEALGISGSVRLQGPASPELTHTCYPAADLFVFTTLITEGFSLVLLEALSCGVASVSSLQPAMEEIYPPEILTLVPDVNLTDVLVAPVVALLRDSQRRSEMGRAARSFVKQNYGQEKGLAQLEQFYRQQMRLVASESAVGGQQ